MENQYSYIVSRAFVVMPYHIHGIIEINRGSIHNENVVETGRVFVGTGRDQSLQKPPKIKSLSELMDAYKTTVSKQIHLLEYPEFQWQRSFHDHIIRNERSFRHIGNYIYNNPSNWDEDQFYGK